MIPPPIITDDSRDLKPGNCLISTGKRTMPRILVGDFGEGQAEGSGKIGTGTIEVYSHMEVWLMAVYCS